MSNNLERYNEVKRLFVQRGLSPDAISKIEGMPHRSTVYTWANNIDSRGRTWWQLRDEAREQMYEDASPAGVTKLLTAEIAAWTRILRDMRMSGEYKFEDISKLSDLLSKMGANIGRLADPSLQIPAMFSVLRDLMLFLHEREAFNADLADLFDEFRGILRARIEGTH